MLDLERRLLLPESQNNESYGLRRATDLETGHPIVVYGDTPAEDVDAFTQILSATGEITRSFPSNLVRGITYSSNVFVALIASLAAAVTGLFNQESKQSENEEQEEQSAFRVANNCVIATVVFAFLCLCASFLYWMFELA